jgi:hypothetical protein
MRFLLLASCILAHSTLSVAQTQADTTPGILIADQSSSYTIPQRAFHKFCSLSSTGNLTGYAKSDLSAGDGTYAKVSTIDVQLSTEDLATLQSEILASKAGPFTSGPAPCDIGFKSIKGLDASANAVSYITMDEVIDCRTITQNKSEAAQSVLKWVGENCDIK